MCEEEIIKCAEFLGNRKDETTVKIDNDFYDERDIWKGLLDLYNKEKEKNSELEELLENSISKDKIRKTIEEIKDLLKQIDYHDIKDKNEREFYKTQYMQYVVARNILQGLLEDNV